MPQLLHEHIRPSHHPAVTSLSVNTVIGLLSHAYLPDFTGWVLQVGLPSLALTLTLATCAAAVDQALPGPIPRLGFVIFLPILRWPYPSDY